MKFPHFFIERPIFAAVLSILIVIIGAIAYPSLPVAQYPSIAPPTVVVTATYPGASAETLAETVAAPLEQAINGVENMIYMTSSSTGNGQTQITISFKQGTDVDQAQVLVQNRVAQAEPRLPEDVRRLGITVNKNSPDFLMVVFFTSPDNSLDIQYISNYVTLQVLDRIARVPGVGQAQAFGGRDYNMRVWIDPGLAAARDMTVDEVVNAIRGQNLQVAAGAVGQPPYGKASPAFELGVQARGRLSSPEEFGAVVVKRDDQGRLTFLRDVARVELGAQDYNFNGYLGGKSAVGMGIFQMPGSNALATADAVKKELDTLAQSFPAGMKYSIDYNPTDYIAESISAVEHTLIEALILVVLVVLVFLQSWRTAIIPIIAIPVSLVGAFAVLLAFGYSLNTLSLFGLVLAIGIVVDDAIVVVENVERLMEEEDISPREAAHKTMDEVSGAIVAISLVLVGVFIPTMFIPGISGAFYQQFAITIASATIISAFVSLTLSPALCALVLKKPEHGREPTPGWRGLPGRLGRKFNSGFNWLSHKYSRLTARLVRMLVIVGVIYLGLILVVAWRFTATPSGFIPPQDQGYLIGVVSLPPGSSLQRTDTVVREAIKESMKLDGVQTSIGFAGLDGASFSTAPNAGVIFFALKPHADRKQSADEIQQALYPALGGIKGGDIIIIAPPPVPGIGTGGGFKMMIQDRSGAGYQALAQASMAMMMGANQAEGVAGAFSLFNTGTPRLTADVDRDRAERMGVPVANIYSTLGSYLGSAYVNDFNYLGRTFRVTAQADAPYRDDASDIQVLKTRSASGQMVPMSAVMALKNDAGPYRVVRYNLYPAAELMGDTKPGYSTGQSLDSMEALAAKTLPKGMGFEWTELAFEQRQAGNTGLIAFGLAVVFVFLLLAALYESLVLPLAVILIVPMCLLAAILGVNVMGLDNNILTQIGLVVLIGLAAKNAILIVEFARQGEEEQGLEPRAAAEQAAHQRMRPIIMTSIAFILGVLPLVIATGAAAELRQALGVAVFFGMIGVTFFGLLFTPAFYVMVRKLAGWAERQRARFSHKKPETPPAPEAEATA
ncbi:HAE1 family hydrophobic/amphiphilic exporter-1 [Sphingomonas naasensis]|uniref:Efflux pump membrane transporter n=1 Tax=Sphingomonas naasensis TaxID=1344951 RepID=A0A4S1WRE1_9SPHN|nr:multidrug efflux RND transporter permease subunit [Sphingomonas naasensis]NIJ18705.1 HAE1 family hydrophobic/amphiphilic exporter-1 [Sphingomonas naasensis]TGX45941.1 efflux RND transporter permease subunit [Sphingomonas naasensis]